jgi:hypothetical protein
MTPDQIWAMEQARMNGQADPMMMMRQMAMGGGRQGGQGGGMGQGMMDAARMGGGQRQIGQAAYMPYTPLMNVSHGMGAMQPPPQIPQMQFQGMQQAQPGSNGGAQRGHDFAMPDINKLATLGADGKTWTPGPQGFPSQGGGDTNASMMKDIGKNAMMAMIGK